LAKDNTTPLMTQRYAHLAPDFLAGEVARLRFAPPAPAGTADMTEERRRRAAEVGQHWDTSTDTDTEKERGIG
jgi:hypothetical protein